MTMLTFLSPEVSSHVRALNIINEFMTVAHEHRARQTLQFEEMVLRREMPIESAYRAAIVNLKG